MNEDIKNLQKNNKLLRALRELFLTDLISEFGNKALITVTGLAICDKSRTAKVYVSFMPSEKSAILIQELEVQKSKIRKLLGNRLANKLRIIPEIKFYLDTSIEKSFYIDKLLKQDHSSYRS